jgi:large subunit ribosomal protein L25
VGEHQAVKISIPVHFKNQDICPGLKRGGTLNIAFHEIEILVAADHIPEEIMVDLKGLNIGDAVHVSDLTLATGARATADGTVVVATVVGTSAMASEDAAADAAVSAEQHADSEATAETAALAADLKAAEADVD